MEWRHFLTYLSNDPRTCDYPGCTYVSSKTKQLRIHKIKLHPTKKDVPFTPKRNKFVAECNNNQTQSYVTTRSRSRCSKTTSRVQNIRNYQTSVVRRSECVDRKRFASDQCDFRFDLFFSFSFSFSF